MTKLRNLITNLATITISVTLALIACEIGLRIYIGIIDDASENQFINRNYITYTDSGRIYGFHPNHEKLRTNSWGFRDREFIIAKTEGEQRVLMLGDSITAGTEVQRDKTISSFLEASLNQNTISAYTVFNLGVTGYNTSQSLATLKEVGLKLSPDIVIYNLCLNDSDPVHSVSQHGLFVNAEISTFSDVNLRTIVGSSYALTFIKTKIMGILSKANPDLIRKLNNPKLTINKRVTEQAWSRMKEEILKIRDVAINNDAHFLVVIYPYASQVGRPINELLPQQDLGIFLESSNISFIDMINIYNAAEKNMFVDSEVHLNAYGTERVARAISTEITSIDDTI